MFTHASQSLGFGTLSLIVDAPDGDPEKMIEPVVDAVIEEIRSFGLTQQGFCLPASAKR